MYAKPCMTARAAGLGGRWIALGMGLLVGAAHAVPVGRQVGFGEPLDENVWTLLSGDRAAVSVADGRLVLSPSAGDPVLLRYHSYGLRSNASRGSRPAFGDFAVELRVEHDAAAQPLMLGLTDGQGWSVRLEYEHGKSRARMLQETPSEAGMLAVEAGEWSAVEVEGPDLLLELVRRGSRIEARAGVAGRQRVVGQWSGRLAPIVDVLIGSRAENDENSPNRIAHLRMKPLPRSSMYYRVQRRAGQPLPGDDTLAEANRRFGGEYLGGYLWSAAERAVFEVTVGNLLSAPNTAVLKLRVTDWQQREVHAASLPIRLQPYEEGLFEVPLPTGRYGYFTGHLTLESEAGEALDAPCSVGYGITAAPLPAEMPERSPVGVHAGAMPRVGAKWVRFWDNGGKAVHWSGIQTEPDRWNWSGLDAYVQRVEAAGLASPVVVLSMTPEWASSNTERSGYRGRGAMSPPTDIAHWVEYVRRTAERYKGRVRHYEIWNEPNSNQLGERGFFFHAPAESYFELMRSAYVTIKEVDPEALVLAPSGTGHFFPFLERIMELGGGDFFDILSIHTYTTPFPPEIGYPFNSEKSYLHRVTRSREILAKHGHEKPIWNTEIGYQSGNLMVAGAPITQDQIAAEALPGHWPNWKPGWSFRPLDPRRAASFFVRFLILTPVYGVERVFIHHRLMATGDGDSSPYMAAPAVGWYSRLLGGAAFVESHDWHPEVQSHGFVAEDGKYVVAVWRVEQESLRMGERDRREAVDSAPVDGIAEQRGLLRTDDPPPRSTYFDPARTIPAALVLSEKPVAAFDLWGNPVDLAETWDIGEAPLYLVFDERPEELHGTVTSRVAGLDAAPSASDGTRGRLLTGAERAPFSASDPVAELLAGMVPLRTAQARRPDASASGGEIHLNANEAAAWILGEELPARARLVLAMRSASQATAAFTFRYRLELDGETLPLQSWDASPPRLLRQGSSWVEMEGLYISEPVQLQPGSELKVVSLQGAGRLYRAWVWPERLEESEMPLPGVAE